MNQLFFYHFQGGGCTKILKELAKDRLIQYESSGLRYNGYRLTWKGYDYLGIKTLVTRGVIRSFGTQIGTGKESNIYSGITKFSMYANMPNDKQTNVPSSLTQSMMQTI